MHGQAMPIGDLVLLETEITPVMTKLVISGGLEITAIHNHILRASPSTTCMSLANDDVLKLARGVQAALEKTAVAQG